MHLVMLVRENSGGQNHRIGLYDMVLIKDNHIAAVGSITDTVKRVRAGDTRKRAIEIEVKNLEELKETLSLNVDRILLDNMSIEQMREAVVVAEGVAGGVVRGRTPLEASGNITLENVAEVAATGMDFISTGAVTHSVKAMDVSLKLGQI